jgi:hypothetical protein
LSQIRGCGLAYGQFVKRAAMLERVRM